MCYQQGTVSGRYNFMSHVDVLLTRDFPGTPKFSTRVLSVNHKEGAQVSTGHRGPTVPGLGQHCKSQGIQERDGCV